MGIKDSTSNWVRGKPAQAMVVIAALGLVIGGVIGLAAGYKIEKSRVQSDVKRLQSELRTAAAGGAAVGGPIGQQVGKVTAVKGAAITLATNKQGTQTVNTTSSTSFAKTGTGTTKDITVGSRVLVALDGADVIVLPKTSKLGRLVTAVGRASFSIARPKGGRPLTIKFTKVKNVSTTDPTDISAVTVNGELFAGGRKTGTNAFGATEVIVLPANNPFVS